MTLLMAVFAFFASAPQFATPPAPNAAPRIAPAEPAAARPPPSGVCVAPEAAVEASLARAAAAAKADCRQAAPRRS
ncbi:hypothetical protein [Methylocella sp.]|uniref:hypothetical protein n=1 Tax=Methylocella sp. TaxID=1978226 RepID=UPI003784E0FD